jgi:hypothetical protein
VTEDVKVGDVPSMDPEEYWRQSKIAVKEEAKKVTVWQLVSAIAGIFKRKRR